MAEIRDVLGLDWDNLPEYTTIYKSFDRLKMWVSADDGHNAPIRTKGYSQRWMAETLYSITKCSLGDAVRGLGWYRQFREIVLMLAISTIEPL